MTQIAARSLRFARVSCVLCLFVGGLNQAALAQAPTPLRVDPALLGLPPARKPEPPVRDAAPSAGAPPTEESREGISGERPDETRERGAMERETTPPDARGAADAPTAPVAETPQMRGEGDSKKEAAEDEARKTTEAVSEEKSTLPAQPEESGASEVSGVSGASGVSDASNASGVPGTLAAPVATPDPASAPPIEFEPGAELGSESDFAPATPRAPRGDAPDNTPEPRLGGVKTRDVDTGENARDVSEARAASAEKPPAPSAEKPRAPWATPTPSEVESVRRLGLLRVDPRLLGLPGVYAPSETGTAADADAPNASNAPTFSGESFEKSVYAEESTDDLPPLELKLSRTLGGVPEGDSGDDRPIFLIADRVVGDGESEMNAYGAAELRKPDVVIKADRLTYWPVEDEIEGEGNARLEHGLDLVSGPKMRMRLEDKVGFFENPTFLVKRQPKNLNTFWMRSPGDLGAPDDPDEAASGFAPPLMIDYKRRNSSAIGRTYSDAHGDAERLDLEGENHYNMTNARFTTCSPDNYDWYLKADELKLDFDKEEGRGRGAALYFKDIPLFYTPILPFSLSNARKSGFLAPSFGATSNVGAMIRTPYYWNIAPNLDALVTPQLLLRRGLLLDSEIRYLDRRSDGNYARGLARLNVLPSDKLRDGENRYGISLMHTQNTPSGFYGQINYNKVSDDRFFTDLSSNVSMTSQGQLLQQGILSYYGGGWWNATANFQAYQTLQPDPKNPIVEQYRMLPQLTFNARQPDLYGTDSNLMVQYTSFSRPKQVINGFLVDPPVGQRVVLYPQVSLPFIRPGWYVTPKVGMNIRRYSLSGGPQGQEHEINVNLPVLSVDSGMTFERKSNWFGRDYTQTLEPRLYYLNIPYKNQSQIPVFDTGLADFNFAQIFSENQFSSWDRVSNANQLTAGLSSRLLDPRSGTEIMRMMLGQRFYFTKGKVGLVEDPTQTQEDRKWDRSDFLASFNGQIYPHLYADFSMQYNFSEREVKRQSIGMRYVPEPGKVFNAAYRYNRDEASPINQVDFSAQWPISGRLYAVGRLNYSFKDAGTTLSTASQAGRVVQAVTGVEYKGGCWVLRGVMQRLALTQDSTSAAFFVQLELNDFASIGSNPIQILRRNIQGYSLVNEPYQDSSYLGQ
ncbi:MAG: LPS assembly protein LptD [Candidatus Accumulibacter sp.]|nr:LPS assembly protein LptD [Accumulibacter sp.]